MMKRFIAGAVCPFCKEQDTIRTFVDNEQAFRECISCGFTDPFVSDEQSEDLVKTRFFKQHKTSSHKNQKKPDEPEEQTLHILS